MTDTSERPAPFDGAVVVKDWLQDPISGRQVTSIRGRVEILKDTDAVGFTVKGNETNWCAKVSGPTRAVYVLGCQVRAVMGVGADVPGDAVRNSTLVLD